MTAGKDRDVPTAATRQELSEYDKGYLDGLLEASRHAGSLKRLEAYKEDAEKYLRSIGREGWSVNVRRI